MFEEAPTFSPKAFILLLARGSEGGFSPVLNPVARGPLRTVASQCVRGVWVLCRTNPWREGPVLSMAVLSIFIPRTNV